MSRALGNFLHPPMQMFLLCSNLEIQDFLYLCVVDVIKTFYEEI